MPIRETVIIDVQGNALDRLEALEKQFKDVEKQVEDTNKKLEDTGKAAKKGAKGTKTLAKGFKAIGTAFKAIGIGIVVALFAKLAEILSRNQAVMDAVSNVMVGLELAFKDLYNFVSDNFMPAFEGMKTFFDNLTFDKIKKAIKENLTERFESLLDMLGYVGTAFKELFAGNFEKAAEAVTNAYKEQIDILTGVNNSVDKVIDGGKKLIESSKEYVKAKYAEGKAIVDIQKASEIAAAEQAKIIAQAVLDADNLRLIRDDETKSIAERKKASDDLKVVLDKQAEATTKQAELQVQAAKQQVALNDSTETRVALLDAETNAIDVVGQVAGLYNEQMTSENSLVKESNELKAERIQKLADEKQETADLATEQALFNADQIENEVDRLEEYKRINSEKAKSDAMRLQAIIDNDNATKEQKETAEAELIRINQAAGQQKVLDEKAISKATVVAKQAEADAKLAIQNESLDVAVQGINVLKSIFEDNKAVMAALLIAENAAGIARIVINTAAANAKAVGQFPLTLGQPWVAINSISAGIGIAGSIAATAKGLSALGKGGKTGGGAKVPSGGSSSGKPSYSIVGDVRATSGGQQATTDAVQDVNDTPIVAQVVAQEVTNQQALDRQVANNSSL